MGVMRRNLFLVLALFTVLCINVKADVTPAQLTEPEYMINGGYSEVAAEGRLGYGAALWIAENPCHPHPDHGIDRCPDPVPGAGDYAGRHLLWTECRF